MHVGPRALGSAASCAPLMEDAGDRRMDGLSPNVSGDPAEAAKKEIPSGADNGTGTKARAEPRSALSISCYEAQPPITNAPRCSIMRKRGVHSQIDGFPPPCAPRKWEEKAQEGPKVDHIGGFVRGPSI